MDPSWIDSIPEPLRTLLIGAAGDFAGGLAADIAGRLLDKAGYQARKRLHPEPQQAALNRAMAEALVVTVKAQTDDPALMAHYLTLFGQWSAREAVAGELSQVIDPRHDVTINLDMLAAEFEALGYDPDLLGGDVEFQAVVAQFVSAFYDAAAREPALQGQIEIGLLRAIAERADKQVQLLRRVADALDAQSLAGQPGKEASTTRIESKGDRPAFFTAPIKGNVEIYQGDVYKIVEANRGELSAKQAAAFLNGYLTWVRNYYDTAQLFGLESLSVASQPKRDALTSVFIPLTVRRFRRPSQREVAEALSGKKGVDFNLALYQLNRSQARAGELVPLAKLLTLSDRLAIVGGAGSGKSTILHYLAVTLARAIQEGGSPPYRLPANQPLIPLLAPLRYYGDYLEKCRNAQTRALDHLLTGTLAGFICWYLQRSSKKGSEEFFLRLLENGNCLLMIDGLDEIVVEGQRGLVREQIEVLARAEYPGNRVIVTAREAGFQDEAVFGDEFTRLDVQDLEPSQIEQLVGNWCQRLYPADVGGNQGKLVRAIREVNDRRRDKALAPLINTPLMVTMVVSVQRSDNTELPRDRAKLYEACVKAVLQAQYTPMEGRDAITDWGGPWEAQRGWLCNLALGMHEGGRAGAALREEQVRAILSSLEKDKLDAFLRAVLYRGGLFEKRADFFQFSHLTFQEFLAARWFASRRAAGRERLEPHVADSWWREVALLTYGILSMESGDLYIGDDLDNSPAVQHLGWLSNLEGSDELRMAGAELAGASVLEIEKPDPALRLQQARVLVGLLENKELSVLGALRAEAGRTLARLGDPRAGVGVLPDGMPGIMWCDVPAEPFLMGEGEEQHTVTLPAFAIAKYPVTNAQYDAFVAEGGYTAKWRECWTRAGWHWKGNQDKSEKVGRVSDLANHPAVMIT